MSYLNSIWRNEQSRGILIQIFVLAGVFALFSWLISNVISNFASLNKGFGFDFLLLPAGYDINQTLIEYTNRSTHLQAAVVGLLNTFLVAAVGVENIVVVETDDAIMVAAKDRVQDVKAISE